MRPCFKHSNPDDILDDIFTRLDSEDKVRRHNALDILTEVFHLNSKMVSNNAILRYIYSNISVYHVFYFANIAIVKSLPTICFNDCK